MKIKLLLLTFLILFLAVPVQAKWWIFGQSNDEVVIKYLYINDLSYDEGTEEITLYEEFLEKGYVIIKGKASVKKGRIGTVQITTDGKGTWKKAVLSKDGAFEYKFTPETDKSYEMYVKILDTSGKSNDVEDTRRVVTVSTQDIRGAVLEVLNKLAEAYSNENTAQFMTIVSDDFDGDAVILDRALNKDFSIFENIDLRFRIYNIASGSKGRVYASISFNRFLVGTRDGVSYSDKGLTEFSFVSEGKGLKVKSMKHPIIFGVSDAANVATGIVVSGVDDEIITVNKRGEISLQPFSEVLNPTEGGEEGDDLNGIPTPENLRIVGGQLHHMVDLEFDWERTWGDLNEYEVIVEESHSSDGPWTEVDRRPGDTFLRITTDAIAQDSTILYYRVKLVKSGSIGNPSNVVAWDNN